MNTNLRKTPIRAIAFAAMFALIASLMPMNWQQASAATRPSNPRVSNDTVTWDCVEFGHYPQSSDGNGEYKEEPIKWRVLAVEGDEALLLADKNLDAQPYHDTRTEINWELSTIRGWLNGTETTDFMGKAFSKMEQSAIYEKNIQTAAYYPTKKLMETKDKIFFLSANDIYNRAYGFEDNYGDPGESNTRVATGNTDYTNSKGHVFTSWWLRSPSPLGSNSAEIVSSDGDFSAIGFRVNDSQTAVRPALCLNLASQNWDYAGTVSCKIGNGSTITDDVSLDRITVAKSKTVYNTNEILNMDDLKVTAFYSDGSSKVVTNYKTNAAAIDMKTAGNKTLTITYEDNAVARTDSISIKVTEASQAASQNNGATVSKPKKVVLKKVVSTKKGTLKLTWQRDKKANGYQVMVATDRKFKKNKKTAVINKNKTVSKTFRKLKKKTYYAKVRAYKQVGKTKLYGTYSRVKHARVK